METQAKCNCQKGAETTLEQNGPLRTGQLLVKHEIAKDNSMVMGVGYGVLLGLLIALVIQTVLKR